MSLLQKIVSKFKTNECEKLVQTRAQEVKINLGIEGGGVKLNLAEFSNEIKELVKVPQIALDLDNTQYLLCQTISKMKGNSELKDKTIAIRLQLIVAFNQLTSLLTSIKEEPSEDLKRKLSKWLRYMEDLHKHSITVLDPSKKSISKSSMPLSVIREYQGIEDKELKDAVKEYSK
jgi:hypothetical protein